MLIEALPPTLKNFLQIIHNFKVILKNSIDLEDNFWRKSEAFIVGNTQLGMRDIVKPT